MYVRDVLLKLTGLLGSPKGRPHCTKHRRTRVQEPGAMLVNVLNASPDGIFQVSQTGAIVFANDAACELFGYERASLLGQPVELLIPQERRAAHVELRRRFQAVATSRGMGSGATIVGLRSDGTHIAIDISLSRVQTPQGVTMYCTVRDIRAQKALEQELRAANHDLSCAVSSLERKAAELRELTAVGELLHGSSCERELFAITVSALNRLFPASSGALYLCTSHRSTCERMADWGPGAKLLRPTIAQSECWALRQSRPWHHSGSVEEPHCNHYLSDAHPPAHCIPLLGHGELLGVLHIFADAADPGVMATGLLGSNPDQLLQAFANQVALSLANLRLREMLRVQSLIDPLTGLYNRRALDEFFEREIANAIKAKRPLSILLVDVDHFKRFNDRFGHESGDHALRELARMFQRRLRGEDIVGRLGGEEFAILLPDTSGPSSMAVGESLRRGAESLALERGGRSLGALTISVGIAALGADGRSAAQLLRHADRALYRAKAAGRNKVTLSSPSDETGVYALSNSTA